MYFSNPLNVPRLHCFPRCEGYEIKITADTFLSISKPSSSDLRDETPKRNSPGMSRPLHPIWMENPYGRMNLWVVGAEGLESGDEIGVFDGEKCVGAAVVSGLVSKQIPLTIITSQDDGSGNGFAEGNDIRFRFWDAGEGTETEAQTPDFLNITTGDPIGSAHIQRQRGLRHHLGASQKLRRY